MGSKIGFKKRMKCTRDDLNRARTILGRVINEMGQNDRHRSLLYIAEGDRMDAVRNLEELGELFKALGLTK